MKNIEIIHYTDVDGLFVLYKGQQLAVRERHILYRGGEEGNYDDFFVLESGKRIFSAHFRYNLVQKHPDTIVWHLRVYTPVYLLKDLIYSENPLLKRIKAGEWPSSIPVQLPYKLDIP